jgi:hypothetical protein
MSIAKPGNDTATVEPMALNAEQTRKALGDISEVTLWRLNKRGLLRPVPGIRHRLYSVASIKRFLARGDAP